MYKLDTAVWEITLRCNLNCLHCGSDADLNERPKELTTDEALDLIEQLQELGCRRVVLSGGEPFMRKDWPVLGQRIKDLGMVLSFITNGFSMNDNHIDVLYQLKPNSVSFSIDGSNAETHDYIRGKEGVFDYVCKIIKKLTDRGQFVSVVTSAHKKNLEQLPDILSLLIDLGVAAWQIQTATPQGRMPQELAMNEREYYKLAEFIAENRQKYKTIIKIMEGDCIGYFSKLSPYMEMTTWQGCQAGMKAMGIESDGAIKGCLSLHGEDYIEGNIRERSLKEIWTDSDNFKYNRRFNPDMLQGICKDCKYGAICRGGCSEKALSFTGTPYGSPFCLYKIESKGYDD